MFKIYSKTFSNMAGIGLVSCILYKIIQYFDKYLDKSYKVIDHVIPDILISCGGRYAGYQLGICHYIKNNFDLTNKKILGISAGSWNAVFMSVKNKTHANIILNKVFEIKKDTLPIALKKTKAAIDTYDINNYNIHNIYIGTTYFNKTIIYNKFLSIDQVSRCCVASSFIPFLTCNELFYFYNNRLTFDGGVHVDKYIKKIPSKTLVIDFKMFGRHMNDIIYKDIFRKNKPTTYELYIKGYHDARKNHSYFDKYLK